MHVVIKKKINIMFKVPHTAGNNDIFVYLIKDIETDETFLIAPSGIRLDHPEQEKLIPFNKVW